MSVFRKSKQKRVNNFSYKKKKRRNREDLLRKRRKQPNLKLINKRNSRNNKTS